MFDVEFRPHPFLRNGHLQTIFGSYWRDRLQAAQSEQFQVPLSDGDTLVLHVDSPTELNPEAPIVLLVHGLGGCHASGYIRRTAYKLNRQGIRTIRLDLRGHGAGLALALHPGHAGRSEDVAGVIEWINQQYPEQCVAVVGFSLGANIVLKLAGEWGSAVPSQVCRLLAIAPPIDLEHCSSNLLRGFNRLYDQLFVRSVQQRVQRLVAEGVVPGPVPHPHPKSLREFDNVYTSVRSGYTDAEDYYTQCSSKPLLHRITLPTIIVAADDDPIVPVRMFSDASFSPATRLIITRSGGHLGYISNGRSDPDRHWLDWRIVEWAMQETTVPQECAAK